MIMTIRNLVLLCAAAGSIGRTPLFAQSPPQWRLVEEWRVGGEPEGAHSFDFNFGLGRLPNGGFVHFDYKTSQLHYLDARGAPVRTVSRRGGGPGETNDANGFAVSADGRVVINDRGNGRFTIFDQRGEFAGAKMAGNRTSRGFEWQALFLKDGRLLETVRVFPAQPDLAMRTFVWSGDLTRADSLTSASCDPASANPVSIPFRTAAGKVIDYFPITFGRPEVPVAYDPAGFKWEPRNAESNEIVRRRIGSCAVVASVRLAGARIPLSPQLKAQVRSFTTTTLESEAKRLGTVVPTIETLPETYPWYRFAFVDDNANLWIERFVTDGKRRLEVYSQTGNHIADIAGGLPPRVGSANIIIAANHVFGLEADRDGIRYLVSYRIEKQ
jgi:hypothetical protein